MTKTSRGLTWMPSRLR